MQLKLRQSSSARPNCFNATLKRASDISRKKKEKFRRIFRGKFAERLADFAGFSREKSQNSQKNRPISWDVRVRKSKFAEKSADFAGF